MSSTTPAKRGSLAAQLALWSCLCTFALVLGATCYLYWALARNLDREDDWALADQIRILRVLLRKHPEHSAGIKQEVELESGMRQQSKMYIRILDEQRRLVAESPGMARRLPIEFFEEPRQGRSGISRRSGEESYRAMSVWAALGNRENARVLQVALDRGEDDKLLAQFRHWSIPLLAVILVLCAFVGYQIARHGLKPIARISETAGRIRTSTLHERIPAADFPSELGALAATFNDMLDRLQESFERLSRFSADIAHELRTPLNNLRGEVEVALGKARSPAEYQETLTSFLEEAGRLSRLIESLLFLARAEHPETQIRREPLDLGKLLEGVREFYEPAAAESGIEIGVSVAGPVPTELDRALLQRAAGNLVENSLAHTAKGGAITLTASRVNGQVTLEVADTGCGIAAEHLPRVFDRLYRVDRSRTAATGGAGLGLAIVKSIAELHGGSARISSEPGKGTTVTLTLPAELTKT